MLDRIHFLVLPVLLVYGLISSVAIVSEASYSLRAQSKLFETTEGPVLMAAEDTASQERVKAFRSYSATDFELAFQKYFSRPWSLMIYQGFGTSTDLGQTLSGYGIIFKNPFLYALGESFHDSNRVDFTFSTPSGDLIINTIGFSELTRPVTRFTINR